MHRLGIKTLYIKENFYSPGYGSMYSVCKPLIELQGIECRPTSGAYPFDEFEAGLEFDYNLDAWRCLPGRGRLHIMFSLMLYFKTFYHGWRLPWLNHIPVSEGQYNLIFLSWRWRDNSKVDWNKIRASIEEPVYFIGHPEDYELFEECYGQIEWLKTMDLLEMANLIGGCKALYTNQSVALVIAQGLGKKYYLEVKPTKTNVLLYTPNENILS